MCKQVGLFPVPSLRIFSFCLLILCNFLVLDLEHYIIMKPDYFLIEREWILLGEEMGMEKLAVVEGTWSSNWIFYVQNPSIFSKREKNIFRSFQTQCLS